MSQVISASLVKDLRERTALGIMECKKALQETNGNIEDAIEHLRKTSAIKAEKKANRAANEGSIAIALSEDKTKLILLEINCETDFVANDENFKNFSSRTVNSLLEKFSQNTDQLLLNECEQSRQELIQKIGENITFSTFKKLEANPGQKIIHYTHSNNKIVSAVVYSGNDESAAYSVAMQVAAMNPDYLVPSDVTNEFISKEKNIYKEEMKNSGKPDNIIDKIVEGKIQKIISENSLMNQSFIKDNNLTVKDFCQQQGINILAFKRIAVGENNSKPA